MNSIGCSEHLIFDHQNLIYPWVEEAVGAEVQGSLNAETWDKQHNLKE